MKIFAILVIQFLFLHSFILADLYSAISDLEMLLHTLGNDLDIFDKYINYHENHLKLIKKQLQLYRSEHVPARNDVENFLGNPINAFILIKRLTTDFDNIQRRIELEKDYFKNILNNTNFKHPTSKDLHGVAAAITRLQETYHLEPRDLANGKINGISYSKPMTIGECYSLAMLLYSKQDYMNSMSWLMESLRKYEFDGKYVNDSLIDGYISKSIILEYIAYTSHLLGDNHMAVKWSHILLEIDPSNERAVANVKNFKKQISYDIETKVKLGTITLGALCRGEMNIPVEISKRLHCRYVTEHHPFLTIAPIKMEQLYVNPDVILFHHVISDSEINKLKNLSKSRIERAKVHDKDSNSEVHSNVRISKIAWFEDKADPVVAKLSRRVSDMTGFDTEYSEQFQITNYGIGGHYIPHYDIVANKSDHPLIGDRIATVLFYLSNVPLGGSTVFTKLKIGVTPTKYTAIYWKNLDSAGDPNLLSKHSACPVLLGSKWAANKWIYNTGQELRKPCDPDEYRKVYNTLPMFP